MLDMLVTLRDLPVYSDIWRSLQILVRPYDQ